MRHPVAMWGCASGVHLSGGRCAGGNRLHVETSQLPPSLPLLPPRQVGEDGERGEKGHLAQD